MKKIAVVVVFLMMYCCDNDQSNASQINFEKELERIEVTRNTFQNAIKQKKYDLINGLVTKDVITIGPGSSNWASMYGMYPDRGAFPYDSIIMSPKETIIVSDSIAYDFGVSRVYYTDTTGVSVALADTFLAILKKGKDNIWRLHREVASSNVNE